MKIKTIQSINFYGAGATLVVAPTSTFKYKDQWRKEFKKAPDLELTIPEIRAMIEEEANDLVIFGGLEWSENIPELIELLSNFGEYRCIIETALPVDDLLSNIGAHGNNNGGFPAELTSVQDDYEMTTFVGQAMLDFLLGDYIILQVKHKGNLEEKLYHFEKEKSNGSLH